MIHPLAGVLSAYGMGQAELRAIRQEASSRGGAGRDHDRRAAWARPAGRLKAATRKRCCWTQGIPAARTETTLRLRLKYQGTDTPARGPARPALRRCARGASTRRTDAGFGVRLARRSPRRRSIARRPLTAEAVGAAPFPLEGGRVGVGGEGRRRCSIAPALETPPRLTWSIRLPHEYHPQPPTLPLRGEGRPLRSRRAGFGCGCDRTRRDRRGDRHRRGRAGLDGAGPIRSPT